jgi:hypothetical protein
MDLAESEKQSKNLQGTFFEVMPRMIVGLISAIVVPSIAIFLLVLLVFVSAAIYSMAIEHQRIGILKLLNEFRVTIGTSYFISAYAIPITVPCVAVFGFPAALIGWRLKLIRRWTCVIVGFFLGSVPGGLFLWNTYSNGSSAANGVQYWINGIPTTAGLIQFLILVLTIGLLGALGGLSFWLVWQLFDRYSAPKPGS